MNVLNAGLVFIQYLALQALASGAIIKLMIDGPLLPGTVAAWLMAESSLPV